MTPTHPPVEKCCPRCGKSAVFLHPGDPFTACCRMEPAVRQPPTPTRAPSAERIAESSVKYFSKQVTLCCTYDRPLLDCCDDCAHARTLINSFYSVAASLAVELSLVCGQLRRAQQALAALGCREVSVTPDAPLGWSEPLRGEYDDCRKCGTGHKQCFYECINNCCDGCDHGVYTAILPSLSQAGAAGNSDSADTEKRD